ncbi:MAG TPA: lytic transglycosylase domain-containing protein [Sphingomicrobium sp.]|nr:lytic transglycosylase domain-containing protein [Sphingomicrobium sp.]
MSSMWRAAATIALLIAVAPSGSAQYAAPAATTAEPVYANQSVAISLETWRALRQSSNYRFSDYAGFLITNPDWPDASRMRGWAENAMQPGENPRTVVAFFATETPRTANGWSRLSDALSSSGQMSAALQSARQAWALPDLSSSDQQTLWSRFGNSFTRADHDERVDALLFAKKPEDAARFLALTSPERQASFAARIALQEDSADAENRYQSVMGNVTRDAGLMMDRVRYLRSKRYEVAADQLASREHNFANKPSNPQRFYEMLIELAGDAVDNRNWQTAYNIASGIDDVLPSGTKIADQPVDVRDDYTTLAWIAATTALDRLHQPVSAIAMFDRYAQAGRSLQVRTKGDYWAARAALAAGRLPDATSYFERAAQYPELFYGQLALERLGRSVAPPPTALPQYVTTQAQRDAFNSRRLVEALRLLGQQGRSTEQALFVRALANSLDNDAERNLAVQLGAQIGRQDLAVWTARMARVKGSMFYVRQAYPTLAAPLSDRLWSLAHGISRQESSFDPYALSHAGARGMMQLMSGTAREEANKMGVGFDSYRLVSDPSYNVMLGSAYFQRVLNNWNGSIPLAVAAYNAGSGNVRKWVDRYGDPRGQVDMLKWIEAIPFSETRAYVQRVIENSVVYDSLRTSPQQQTSLPVSRYLGKDRPA